MRAKEEVLEEKEVVAARLLYLRKAYPHVNKPALWRLLQRYGVDGNFLRTLQGLNEATEFKIRGKEGVYKRGVGAGKGSEGGLPFVSSTLQHLSSGGDAGG